MPRDPIRTCAKSGRKKDDLMNCGVYSTLGVIGWPFSSNTLDMSNAERRDAMLMNICAEKQSSNQRAGDPSL